MPAQLSRDPNLEPLSRVQILVIIGLTAALMLALAKVWQRLGAIALLPLTWNGTDLTIGIGLGLAITAASALIYGFWPTYRTSTDAYLSLVLKPLLWPDLVWLGLLPGLSEELLFRGVMLSALGLDSVAVVASSLCFGVLHWGGQQHWPYVLWATLVGGVLGVFALATGNVLVPVAAHVTTNLISSCAWKLYLSRRSSLF